LHAPIEACRLHYRLVVLVFRRFVNLFGLRRSMILSPTT